MHVPDYVVELYDVLNFSDNKTVIKQTMERLNLVIDVYQVRSGVQLQEESKQWVSLSKQTLSEETDLI